MLGKLYRIPGGVVLYTQEDVDHLLRFYEWQLFVRVPWWDLRARWQSRR